MPALIPPYPTASEPPRPAPDDKTSSADRIARLVAQLGSEHFTEREAASRALEGIGVPALRALRGAAAGNPDAEVRNFAAMQISQALGLDLEVKGNWTPQEWADFRAQVRRALARE